MSRNHKDDDNKMPELPEVWTLDGYISRYYHPDVLKNHAFMGDKGPLQFWRWLLEPTHSSEIPQKGRRKWSYADRLAMCALVFIAMPDEDQAYILKLRNLDPPIWWRGDDMWLFKRIARETYRYNQLSPELKETYKKNVLMQAQRMQRENAR